ncbi:Uncharacterised protein [Mycobacterium tuberculosis]|nr:Uncharacterised protein [Mycobacterium tuberculosis]
MKSSQCLVSNARRYRYLSCLIAAMSAGSPGVTTPLQHTGSRVALGYEPIPVRGVVPQRAGSSVTRAVVDRPADRPIGHGLVYTGIRPPGDAADRHRGVGGRQPDLHQAHAKGAELRGRRRAHHLQGATARHRRAAAIHGLPFHPARPLARRVSPRPLRCAARRGADGRRLRRRHVPHHRRSDVRRHRDRDQPARAGAPHPPAAPQAGRPASALCVDRHHRRVLSRG